MEYLTTHDLVWINTTITGVAAPYNYVTLEAAMAGQYSYGNSSDIKSQAANLLRSLLLKAPFGAGNARTALVAVITFLNANGYAVAVSDDVAAALVRSAADGEKTGAEVVESLCAPSGAAPPAALPLRKLITAACNTHRSALEQLASGD